MALAARQHGVITWDQMRELGITAAAIRWRTTNGVLEEILPGVFRACASTKSWEQRLIAACRWGGPGTAASHRSAAALWKFDGFSPGPLEISTLKQNRAGLPFKVHRTRVDPAFTTSKLGIPVTNAFRTLRDVVTVVSEERGNQLFDELLREGLVSMESLRRLVDREKCSGRRGVGVLRRLVEQREPGYQPSASEFQALVGRLLTGAGLAFVEEYVITDSHGTFIARADFKLLDAPVIVDSMTLSFAFWQARST